MDRGRKVLEDTRLDPHEQRALKGRCLGRDDAADLLFCFCSPPGGKRSAGGWVVFVFFPPPPPELES